MYAYLQQHPEVQRIVYIRQDQQSESFRPVHAGIDFVLGKKILYDLSYYDTFPIDVQVHDDFPIDSMFFSSHVMYARLLNDVQIVPLIV